ncbi:MAG TPA: 5'/3'-nucleotidase SurE [Anaerolineaceae bacterium]|nr:5'/3'-nucleotidase SurE [Anaerolineaceae bacterium]HPN52235.1 5'/3'-nucleotidase SurE [Anaerolineaceae bacterium]
MEKAQILLTNDDGIESPGLWAAAEALSAVGYVHVVAPRVQYSGAGRGHPIDSDGIIQPRSLTVHGQEWTVYAVGGSPAQTVQFGLLDILPRRPDLVVSGINYGENLGTGVTVSGTVGAAIEAAASGIPALAVSLQTPADHYFTHSQDINFSSAGQFTAHFARLMLSGQFPPDVDILKIDVPDNATAQTPWNWARLARSPYYKLYKPQRASWNEPGSIGFNIELDPRTLPEDTDIYTLLVKRQVAVVPLSVDMTARVDLDDLTSRFNR